MSLSKRHQTIVLGALVALLGVVVYLNWSPSSAVPIAAAVEEKYKAVSLENPSLRTDQLERIREFEYPAGGRNIFSVSLPPPPAPKPDEPVKIGPAPPPPLVPVQVPVRFFGYVADVRSGLRRAFFTNGEDVFIMAEGETLQNRYRLLRIGNNAAEFEEISSGRRATLALEEPGPTA